MLLARVGFSGAALAGRGTTASVQTRQSLRLLSLRSLRPDLHCLADEDQQSFEVTNPATGELVALVPDQTKAEVKQACQPAVLLDMAYLDMSSPSTDACAGFARCT